MPKGKAASSSESSRKMRPALSPEARENQLVSFPEDWSADLNCILLTNLIQ